MKNHVKSWKVMRKSWQMDDAIDDEIENNSTKPPSTKSNTNYTQKTKETPEKPNSIYVEIPFEIYSHRTP